MSEILRNKSPFLQKSLKILIFSCIALQSSKIDIHILYHNVLKFYPENFKNLKILDFTELQSILVIHFLAIFPIFTNFEKTLKVLFLAV